MTNTNAHTFDAWFDNNSIERTRRTLSNVAACGKVFDRYAEDVFSAVAEAAVATRTDFHETLAERYAVDMIDSLPMFKWLAVRFACERRAAGQLMLEEAA